MALTISGTSNGKLGNLSLSASTGDILDSANTTFFGVDLWYLNTTTIGNGVLTNWTRMADTPISAAESGVFGSVGTGMTVSSGNFTFPSTGIYRVGYKLRMYNNGTTVYTQPFLEATSDNSTYSKTGDNGNTIENGYHEQVLNETYIDCQDTSNYKIRVNITGNTNNYTWGSTTTGESIIYFIRLGDT